MKYNYYSLLISLFFVVFVNTPIFAQNTININDQSTRSQISLRSSHLPLSAGKDLKGVSKQRYFQYNKQLLSLSQENKGDVLLLDFFEDRKYKAVIRNVTKNESGTISMTGKIEDTEFGYCYIVISDNGVTISAELPATDEIFIASTKSGESYLFQSSLSATKEDEIRSSEPLIPTNPTLLRSISQEEPSDIQDKPSVANDNINENVTIDLMMVYTPAAEQWANSSGTVTNMEHLIILALERANLTMNNSETGITFRRVHTHKTNYTEVDSQVDLDRVTGTSDGYMDEVHALRNQYNADIVVFIPRVTYTGGQAWLLTTERGSPDQAFALSRVQQTASGYTMVHEIGHNMGCMHHKLQGGTGLFSYSYGWGGVTNMDRRYSTIMTYETGSHYPSGQTYSRIPYFSDPDRTFEGVPIGDVNDANNVLTLKRVKHLVSRYRVAATDNADLKSITLSSGNLNPAFSHAVSNYTVKVLSTTDRISIGGQTDNPSSTLTGSVTNYPLTIGENIIDLTVTSPSGMTRTYRITVIRLEPLPETLWIKQNSEVSTNLNAIQMLNETTGYICGNNGVILKTTNGGKNWTRQTSGTSANLNDILFLDHNVGYAVGANGTFLKTTNGGTNWNSIYTLSGSNINGIFVESASEIWLMCSNGLFRYNGTTTVTPTARTSAHYAICKPNENTLAIGAYTNGIIYTTNKTNYYSIAPYPSSSQFYGIATWPGTNLAIACSRGGELQRANFSAFPTQMTLLSTVTNDLKDITFASSNTVYSVGNAGTIIKSTDQGDFWLNISPTSINTSNLEAVSFPSEENGWVVGANGTILHTTSPGNIPVPDALPATEISSSGFTANWGRIETNLDVQYELSVYYNEGSNQVSVAGSPFTGLSGTSKVITGLTPGTNYFYTVNTVIGGYASAESNEISVATLTPITATWLGSHSSNWVETANWQGQIAPSYNDDVIVSSSAINYPVLSTPTTIKSITIESGAEIGNQHLLVYDEATVEYGLSTKRWNQITTPIETTIESSFHFDRNPSTWVQTFASKGLNAGWEYVSSLEHSFSIGDGFVLWIAGSGNNYPFSITGTLAGANIAKTLNFINDGGGGSFALVGNPFMSTIDFESLATNNSGIIGNSYLIWMEEGGNSGYAGYNTSVGGAYGLSPGVSLNQHIAPLQSFIVEKGANAGDLVFNASIQATGSGNGLRASKSRSSKLDIIAENEAASVITFIANHEHGQDSRKLFSQMGKIPDIYTLKEETALGANIINTDDILIPIGLSTTYSGNMSFTFNGMDSYDANISFIDVLGETIDISNRPTYTYSFNYTPAVDKEEKVISSENRFFIQLSSENIATEAHWVNAIGKANVYAKDNTIHVTSTPSNLIKQVIVFNIQGQELYVSDQLNTSAYSINRPENTGICVVKVVTEYGTQSQKLIND